jgi:hypothetical protein
MCHHLLHLEYTYSVFSQLSPVERTEVTASIHQATDHLVLQSDCTRNIGAFKTTSLASNKPRKKTKIQVWLTGHKKLNNCFSSHIRTTTGRLDNISNQTASHLYKYI